MAKVPWSEKAMSREELACVYSALILADDDLPITEDKIKTLLAAAEVDIDNIWPCLYAKALQSINIKELIIGCVSGGVATGGGGGGFAGAGGAPAGAGGPPKEEEEKAEEKPPAPEEDSEEEDFGFGLFD